jgi:ABC-type sugar transport system ATPase subunit
MHKGVTSMNVVEMLGISKQFPGILALNNVDFDLKEGEIHGLVGENGAGKSTLVKILTGVIKPTAGSILIYGSKVSKWDISEAYKYIGAVYQERELVPFFTGLQNLFLGFEISKGSFLIEREMFKQANRLLNKYKIEVPLDIPVNELSPGQQQMVTILKILFRNPKVVVFDEPTAPLSLSEKKSLYELIKNLKAKGVTILYISHYLSEVLDLCDRITVLRNGIKVSTVESSKVTEDELIELMIDKSIKEQYPKECVEPGEIVFEAKNVSFDKMGIHDVSFNIRSGEIVGFAGLVGAGRTELARAIYLGKKFDRGEIYIFGNKFVSKSSWHSIKNGIVMIPENRRTEGLILDLSIKENLTLPVLKNLSNMGFIAESVVAQISERIRERLSIRCSSLRQMVRTLSGGNQQKVSLGKWFAGKAKVWIFDEPTQGIDVEAKREIYQIMGDLAKNGAAIWFISSDLKELVAISDRIYVMRKGKIISEHQRPFNEAQILRQMLGGEEF